MQSTYDCRQRVCLTRSQGVANLLFTLCAPDVSFQRGFLIYVKIRADLQSKKFHFSGLQFNQLTLVKKRKEKNIYLGHLELVPSSISASLILPSIRQYRIEYLALYAVLATKYLFHTHKWFIQMTKTLKTFFFFIFYHPSPRQPAGKVQSFGPGPGG